MLELNRANDIFRRRPWQDFDYDFERQLKFLLPAKLGSALKLTKKIQRLPNSELRVFFSNKVPALLHLAALDLISN